MTEMRSVWREKPTHFYLNGFNFFFKPVYSHGISLQISFWVLPQHWRLRAKNMTTTCACLLVPGTVNPCKISFGCDNLFYQILKSIFLNIVRLYDWIFWWISRLKPTLQHKHCKHVVRLKWSIFKMLRPRDTQNSIFLLDVFYSLVMGLRNF